MNQNDARFLANQLAGFFPGQLSKPEKYEASRRFADFSRPVVERVLGERWERFKRQKIALDLPEFFEACKSQSDSIKTRSVPEARTEQTTAGVYRNVDPEFRNMTSDAEVIISCTRKIWLLKGRKEERHIPWMQRDCAMKLLGLTVNGDVIGDIPVAMEWAAVAFSDQAHFELCMTQLRGELAAR